MANISVSDYAGEAESFTGTVTLHVTDFAAAIEAVFEVPNRSLPALVLMAAAYQGTT